jgi:integrase
MGKLTVRAIESAKPKAEPYKLVDGNGLQLRVATDGAKSWLIRYMIDGSERQFRLPKEYKAEGGEGYCSLADARAESAKIRALARQGVDYQVKLEQDAKAAATVTAADAAKDLTVKDLFDQWVVDGINRKDGGAEIRRAFGRDVLPKIGKLRLIAIEESDVRKLLATIVKRGANRHAVKVLGDLKQMFRWGTKRKPWKLVIDDPAEGLKPEKITAPDYTGNERTRALSPAEIAELGPKLKSAGLLHRTEYAMWIMMGTCTRIGEVTQSKWEHVDLDKGIWIIPSENSKNKIPHTVYLSPFALDYFKRLKPLAGLSPWCFPRDDGKGPVCIKSTTKQIRDRQVAASGRPAMRNRSKLTSALLLSGGDWTPHDLRRTGATLLQSLGITPEVIERVLNHTEPNKLRRTYQTYDYASEKTEAWLKLGARLEVILAVEKQHD